MTQEPGRDLGTEVEAAFVLGRQQPPKQERYRPPVPVSPSSFPMTPHAQTDSPSGLHAAGCDGTFCVLAGGSAFPCEHGAV